MQATNYKESVSLLSAVAKKKTLRRKCFKKPAGSMLKRLLKTHSRENKLANIEVGA